MRCAGFSLWWLLLLRSTGFRCVASVVVAPGLSSCGSRAQLLHGMWDLPGPGIEPVSPALAAGFLTTAPRKSLHAHFCPASGPTRDSTPPKQAGGQWGLLALLLAGAAHPAPGSHAPASCGHRQPSPSRQASCLCSHPDHLLRDPYCQPAGVQ